MKMWLRLKREMKSVKRFKPYLKINCVNLKKRLKKAITKMINRQSVLRKMLVIRPERS